MRKLKNVWQAKKLWKKGIKVFATPCKCNLQWLNFEMRSTEDFDKQANAISYYNCNYETGRYLHYYVKED